MRWPGPTHRQTYEKPGTNLGQYNKVKLLDCYVDFVRDKDAEKIKQKLAAEFKKVFTKVLTEKGFPIVDEVGADVLLLRPALINLDVTAPDILTADMRTTLISSVGRVTGQASG